MLPQGDITAANVAYERACRAAATAPNATSSEGGGAGGSAVSYELLPALEWAAVRSAAGEVAAAAQVLSTAISGAFSGGGSIAVQPRPAVALADVASVQRALLLMQLGELEAARVAAADAVVAEPVARVRPSASLRAAAHSVQSAAALLQAALAEVETVSEGEAAVVVGTVRKKNLLEAR